MEELNGGLKCIYNAILSFAFGIHSYGAFNACVIKDKDSY